MEELDLHGLKHHEVEDRVEDFILKTDTPFRIITGNSEEMKRITLRLLDHYDFKFYSPAHNAGEIIVTD